MKDAKTYDLPSVSKVAALIVGDLDPTIGEHDILVESKSGVFKRISELNFAYLPLQYPILFSYGDDGYMEDTQFTGLGVNQNGWWSTSYITKGTLFFSYTWEVKWNINSIVCEEVVLTVFSWCVHNGEIWKTYIHKKQPKRIEVCAQKKNGTTIVY